MNVEEITEDLDDCDVPGVACGECGNVVLYREQWLSVQAELKKFLQQQEAGLDCTI